MSSSYDAGYYASQLSKAQKEPCPKRKDKEPYEFVHDHGGWPSIAYKCKHCGEMQYTK